MEHIIEKISKKLTSEVPELKYVDQDWGQMDFYSRPPVKFPCALLDIQSAEYSNCGNFIQQGIVTVVIRVFDVKLSNQLGAASAEAPANQKENARKIWSLLKKINISLHAQDFLQEGYGLPVRRQLRRTKRNDGCYQNELFYTVQFTDKSMEAVTEKHHVEPKLYVSLKV
jgi:hypothetical protein